MTHDSKGATSFSGIPFQGHTRRFAFWLLLVFILVWGALVYYVFQSGWQAGLARAENEVRKMTLMQQAIRAYVDGELKPLFFDLQQKGRLSADYYAPQGFSATYVISHVFKFYDQRVANNLAELKNGVFFRIVSDNPLNPHNLATDEQKAWLAYFRTHPQVQEMMRLTHKDGQPAELHLYRPSPPNTQACLRCHGDPFAAPTGLRRLYGTSSGFGEHVGWIRGLSEYRINVRPLWQATWQHTLQLAIVLFGAMLLLWAGIVWIYHRLMLDRDVILRQKQRLFELANCDALTGLFNRHRLHSVLPEKLAQLQRGQLTSLTAILLDIDHFKSFNDRFGHDVGDRVLEVVAEALSNMCLEFEHLVFRLGGEEFLILIDNLPTDGELCARVQACHQQLPHHYDGVPETITFSAGVALADATDTPSSLLKKADIALYYVKQHGRNGIACYHTLPHDQDGAQEH